MRVKVQEDFADGSVCADRMQGNHRTGNLSHCSVKTNKSSSDFIFGSVSSSSSLYSSELQTRFILQVLQPPTLCGGSDGKTNIFSTFSASLSALSSHKTYASAPRPSNSK